MKKIPCSFRILLFVSVLFCVSSIGAAQWPQFRGPHSNQLGLDSPLPQVWSQDKNIQWQVPIPGRAWSSPVMWGDKIFITNAVDDVLESSGSSDRFVKSGSRIRPTNDHRWEITCLEKDSGKILWTKVAARGKPTMVLHSDNSHASETPVTDGERVYAFFGNKGLYCYDFQGKLLWNKDLGVHKMQSEWGTGSSPLIHEGVVYLQIDNEEQSFLMALEGKTGKEIWRLSRQEKSNWSTPIIWQNQKRTELVTGGRTVYAYDPVTRDQLWKLDVEGRCVASPTAVGDLLFFGTEKRSNKGGTLFAVKAGASGDITPQAGASTSSGVLWSQPDAGIAFASPLVYRDHVYILERARGGIKCFHAQTGELKYSERLSGVRFFWASPWASHGKIFCLDDRGTTHVVEAGSEFKVLGQNKLNEDNYASCAFTSNSIILRGVESLYCIAESEIGSAATHYEPEDSQTKYWEMEKSPGDTGYYRVKDWLKLPPGTISEKVKISGATVDSKDRIYLLSLGNEEILPTVTCVDIKGKLLFQWKLKGVIRPHLIHCDRKDQIWFTDNLAHQIHRLNDKGEIVFSLGEKGVKGTDPKHYDQPTDIDFLPDGSCLIGEGYGDSKRIIKLDTDFNYVKEWGSKGTEPGQLSMAHALTVGSDGNIYVSDRDAYRVQVFDPDGKLLQVWPHIGKVFDMVESSDHIFYCADSTTDHLTAVDAKGRVIGFISDPNIDIGHGIAITSQDDLIVALPGGRAEKYSRKTKK
ncbi:PQQ-binding-like beta-propeller repeat protein [Planctomycetota bacterium]